MGPTHRPPPTIKPGLRSAMDYIHLFMALVSLTVRHVHHRQHDRLQALVKHVALAQLRLEVRAARQHQPRHVGPVAADEELHRQLSHLRRRQRARRTRAQPPLVISFICLSLH